MTLVAQILNFLILVALLRAFCYKPVVRLLKARQDRIAESLNKADADAAEADKLLASYKAKLAEANKKAEAIVSRAQAQAEQEHSERRSFSLLLEK
jgi:F-type H+-transporting ATPase subunit b